MPLYIRPSQKPVERGHPCTKCGGDVIELPGLEPASLTAIETVNKLLFILVPEAPPRLALEVGS